MEQKTTGGIEQEYAKMLEYEKCRPLYAKIDKLQKENEKLKIVIRACRCNVSFAKTQAEQDPTVTSTEKELSKLLRGTAFHGI